MDWLVFWTLLIQLVIAAVVFSLVGSLLVFMIANNIAAGWRTGQTPKPRRKIL